MGRYYRWERGYEKQALRSGYSITAEDQSLIHGPLAHEQFPERS